MKRFVFPSITALFLCTLSSSVFSSAESDPWQDETIRQGRYLAMGVAMCVDCHSPKLPSGELDPNRILMGTEISVQPIEPVPDWVAYAPAIAGLPNHSDDEIIEVLTTGMIGETYLRPPMPVYQMNLEDAEAIVAYLRSLEPPDEAP